MVRRLNKVLLGGWYPRGYQWW